jgi:hypothetical protein
MVMALRLRPRGRGWAFVGGALLGWAVCLGVAGATPITWDKKGAFETCLESSLEAWLLAQAQLQVIEDPAAAKLDDRAVAAWTVETIGRCRALAKAGDASSEQRFARHMAQWRQHIYERAVDIRKKGVSD